MDWRYSGSGISAAGRSDLAAITSRGRTLVTVANAAKILNLDSQSAAKKLARWAHEGWLRRVKRGLYAIVPIDAENPKAWSVDPLVVANAVWDPCYFTGWTAANHWALTDQVFRTTVVKTTQRVRKRKVKLLNNEYALTHTTEHAMSWGVSAVWHDQWRLSFADPARTVIDILDKPSLGGGIRHAAEILSTYLDERDPDTLISYGDLFGNRAVFKRLGFLLEAIDRPEHLLLEACRRRVSAGLALLDPDGEATGPRSREWNLRANVRVTSEGPS